MKKGVVLLVLGFVLLLGLLVQCRGASEMDAQSALNKASERIVTCYKAVANASTAGANVSAFIQVLDAASNLLSKAELAFIHGDLNASYAFARESQQTLEGFETRVASEQNDAAQANYAGFMVNLVGSLIAPAAVLGGSIALWTRLKKRVTKVVE